MKEYLKFTDYYVRNYGKAEIKYQDLHFYSTYLLANFCMPTLLNIKPSSLIRINKIYISDIVQFLSILKDEIENFSCTYSVMHENDNMLLLLIYNRNQLNKIIRHPKVSRYLTSIGYRLEKDPVSSALDTWKQRYQVYEAYHCIERKSGSVTWEYPHEIGLLLGFPYKDVEGFIRYQGRNYLCCGYWKVYHNRRKALEIFDSYRKARDTALQFLQSGKALKDIADYPLKKQKKML